MDHISAREARNHFSELIDNAQHGPVTVERHGRSVAVLMSVREYERLKLENLRARLALGEAQLERGEGTRQSAGDVIREHKAQSGNG